MEAEFARLLMELAQAGIEPILKQKNGVVYADLDTRTKSGMYLHQDLTVTGRYNEHDDVYSVKDLVCVFVSRYRTHDFGCDKWLDLAIKMGYLTKHVETKVTYR